MSGLLFAGWAALRALKRGDLTAYDRWTVRASRAADDLARRLEGVRSCVTCGDPIAAPYNRDRCVVCRSIGSWRYGRKAAS